MNPHDLRKTGLLGDLHGSTYLEGRIRMSYLFHGMLWSLKAALGKPWALYLWRNV